MSALKDESHGSSDRLRLRNAFVTSQVALSILLVVCAGLFLRALERAGSIDPGFDARGVELASLDLSLAGYSDTTGPLFVRELVDRLRALPGVQAASVTTTLPMGPLLMRLPGLTVPSVTPPNGQPFVAADSNVVEPGYFATMRIPLVAGRDFADSDRAGTSPVAIVGEATAQRLWPAQNAIGKLVRLEAGSWRRTASTLQVVGVVRDVKYRSLGEDAPPLFVYMPIQQQFSGSNKTVVVRTAQGQRVAAEIRAVIASLNPNLPIVTAQTLEDATALSLVPQRIAVSVSGSLGIVGLLLAMIGMYGVTAYAVASRTREIGIRVALGAEPVSIVGMVLRQGMSLAAIGGVVGLVLAAAAGQLLTGLLFGITPLDPITFGGAAILFAIVGLTACYVPARRATKVSPLVALRYE